MSEQSSKSRYDSETMSKFEQWLDDVIDTDTNGSPITRRSQLDLGPAPDFARGWAMIGFVAGFNSR